MAEATAAAMSVCPFHTIVTTLAPLIQTSPYPPVLGAIKMLTKLIETNPTDVTDEHLSMIMPGLIKVCAVLLRTQFLRSIHELPLLFAVDVAVVR